MSETPEEAKELFRIACEALPGFEGLVKEAYELGLIPGLRAIRSVTVNGVTHGLPPLPTNGISGEQLYHYKCARAACHSPDSVYWNSSTRAYYCPRCAKEINRQNGVELCTLDPKRQASLRGRHAKPSST